MSKYWIYVGSVIAVLIAGGAYFSYKDVSLKNKLESQQKTIGELQSYKDEQLSLAQEKIQQEEESERIAEQNQIEQQGVNAKRDCEDTKRYCSEEIKSRKASIDDIKKQVKAGKEDAEYQKEKCDNAKAKYKSGEDSEKIVEHACLKTLSESMLDGYKQNLADQEKGLGDLLKGKCLNYQVSCE